MAKVEEPLNLRHSSFVVRPLDGRLFDNQPSAVCAIAA